MSDVGIRKMRSLQVKAPGRAEIVETPIPRLKPGHALIRTVFLSICGSDLYLLHHAPRDNYPFPPGTTGHEMVGVVEAVDDPGSPIGEGDRVLALAPRNTAMTEFFLSPTEFLIPLPENLPFEHGLMAQQLGTVVFACGRLPDMNGKTAVVIGQGSAGLFFDAILKRLGTKKIIAFDILDNRISMGREFGATDVFNNKDSDPLESVAEITGGNLADLVVEAAGEVETINLAAHLVREEGLVFYFGKPHEHVFPFDFWTLSRKFCWTTSTGASSTRDPGLASYRTALELIKNGDIDVSRMITHRFPFEKVMDAYELARTREDGVIKTLIEMPGADSFGAGPTSSA